MRPGATYGSTTSIRQTPSKAFAKKTTKVLRNSLANLGLQSKTSFMNLVRLLATLRLAKLCLGATSRVYQKVRLKKEGAQPS
jgi:hypothetical protein